MNVRQLASLHAPFETLTSSATANDNESDTPMASVTSLPVCSHRVSQDLVTRAFRTLAPQLRAACLRLVPRNDVDDLVQEVFVVAVRSQAKLAQSDRATLNWLIGIARRSAANHVRAARMVPIEALLGREAGDDREGEEPFAKIPW